ncbi:DUF6158 family protein [Sphaerisporangium sp. NPDC005289]|uniref:DUF6158 family protein n=1 Tax=Sphaerisporangium sp. NPDC005289 TaxID=3155247 RepID=UPI00339EC313
MNRVDPRNLSVRDLRAELQELEESWMETLLRGSEDAVDDFASRTRELEEEFDRRQRERAGEAAPTSQDAGLSGQDAALSGQHPAPISQDPAHTSQDPAHTSQDPALSGQDPVSGGKDAVPGGKDAVPGGLESDLGPVAGREPERTASQAMGGEPRREAQDGLGPDVDVESRREAQGELRLDVDGAPAAPPFPHEDVSTPVASPAGPEAAPSPAVSEAAPSPAAPPVGPEAAVSPAGPEAAVSPAAPEAGVPSGGSPAVREEPAGACRGWDGAGVAGDGGRGRAIRPGRRRRDGVPAVREQRSPGKVA